MRPMMKQRLPTTSISTLKKDMRSKSTPILIHQNIKPILEKRSFPLTGALLHGRDKKTVGFSQMFRFTGVMPIALALKAKASLLG